MGPYIHLVADFHPEILVQALTYTGIAFVSFSLVSLMSKKRSYLFLGGVISTLTLCMALYGLFSFCFGSHRFGLPYMMCGLFVACLYIIYDTQVIIEKAERGDKDVPTHAMMLFVDLFVLFIRILQILIELQSENSKSKNKKK